MSTAPREEEVSGARDGVSGWEREVPVALDLLPAGVEDLPFLREMLYEAAFWRPGADRPPLDEALERPELAVYLEEWGRPGDHGLVAHVAGRPVGAVWVRRFDRHRHGYGYLDDSTPELTLAVAASSRRRGIGRRLLTAMLTDGRLSGPTRVSLSVEADNPARTLYEQLGCSTVDTADGALTMTRDLTRPLPS